MLRRWLLCAGLTIGLLLLFQGSADAQIKQSPHLALGMPKDAKENLKKPDKKNHLMTRPHFALSYNSQKGTPNWVSWRLVKSDFGTAKRPESAFAPDESLPAPLFKVLPKHYLHAGFDRGHLCPNADRDDTVENATATFVMTNMIPQSPELNRNSWADLEEHCREIASKGKEVYIVAGPAGQGGWGVVEKREKGKVIERLKVFRSTLADGKVTVPALCWKVVLAIDPGPEDPAKRVTQKSQLFAVIMHNDQSPKKWQDFVVPVAEVEKLTGFSFFAKAPADVLDDLDAANHKLSPQTLLGPRRLEEGLDPFRFALAPLRVVR